MEAYLVMADVGEIWRDPSTFQSYVWDGDSWLTLDARLDQLVRKAVGTAPPAVAVSPLSATDAMKQMLESMKRATDSIDTAVARTRDLNTQGLGISGMGAFGAVLRRRPLRIDARIEVISYLRRELGNTASPEPWHSGAYFGGTTLYLDDELEPGFVRAHLRGQGSPGDRQEIYIGDLEESE